MEPRRTRTTTTLLIEYREAWARMRVGVSRAGNSPAQSRPRSLAQYIIQMAPLSRVIANSEPDNSPWNRTRQEPHQSDSAANLSVGIGAGQLDPNPVRVFDVGEPTVPLGEGRAPGPGPFRPQLPVRPLDILALERDVVQLVPVAIGSREELGTVRVPVQLEHLLRPVAAQLRPFAARFRDVLTPDDLHP